MRIKSRKISFVLTSEYFCSKLVESFFGAEAVCRFNGIYKEGGAFKVCARFTLYELFALLDCFGGICALFDCLPLSPMVSISTL